MVKAIIAAIIGAVFLIAGAIVDIFYWYVKPEKLILVGIICFVVAYAGLAFAEKMNNRQKTGT